MDCGEVIKKKDSPKTDMDIINKNINTNGNHSNNAGKYKRQKN